MSLFSIAERFSSLDFSTLKMDQERCLHSQDRFSGCQACFEICPVGAITPGKPPSLNPEKCAKCLACLMVCPVGAYRADDEFTPLLAAAKRLKAAPLSCCASATRAPPWVFRRPVLAFASKGAWPVWVRGLTWWQFLGMSTSWCGRMPAPLANGPPFRDRWKRRSAMPGSCWKARAKTARLHVFRGWNLPSNARFGKRLARRFPGVTSSTRLCSRDANARPRGG